MKKLLIRAASGFVYVVLVIFVIGFTPWFHQRMLGYAIFSLFFLTMAMIGIWEYYHCLEFKGLKVNKRLGMLVALMTYAAFSFCCLCDHMDAIIGIIPAIWAIIPLAQLWNKDEQPFATTGLNLLPLIWIVLPLTTIQLIGNFSLGLLLMVFFCTWVNDTFAYLTGMAFGKHKFWPRHSPNKTWEGTLGGMVCCILFAVFIGPLVQTQFAWYYWLAVGLICSVAGTLGDLVESMFKRYCGVKDSGNIMPGHGGILDRFDSIIMITPFMLAMIGLARILI